MTKTRYLQFEGLNNPVAFERAGPLEEMVTSILSGWPHRVATQAVAPSPFVTIRPEDSEFWSLKTCDNPSAPRKWDSVNAVCDLVAEMAWERLRSDPELLCLHAAAADFGGRLVVFPNARRAGKSTLAAALAGLGKRLFTDDYLPIRIDASSGQILGISNGVAPRIRLPLPDEFSATLKNWVAQDPGPANRQYKYLLNVPVAPGGEELPLGAMVVLDRQDAPIAPELERLPREEALASLITQNFSRAMHAGTILKSIDAITQHLPLFRLSYHSGEEAAAFLATHPELVGLPAAKMGDNAHESHAAPLHQIDQAAPVFVAELKYMQAPGLTETEAGDEHFLADGTGLAIHRLNAGSAAIWRLLSEPTDLEEVIAILTAAFPDTAPAQIAYDSEQLMHSLAAARLIAPVDIELAAQ